MPTHIEPLEDKIIVKVIEPETVTAGGIILPEVATERSQTGHVVSVGPGRTTDNGTLVKPKVEVGDEVLFAMYAGTEVNVDGEELLVLAARDIHAVIRKE